MFNEPLGCLIMDEYSLGGKRYPTQKILIYEIDPGTVSLSERKLNDIVSVMDGDGNWHRIKVGDILPAPFDAPLLDVDEESRYNTQDDISKIRLKKLARSSGNELYQEAKCICEQ